MIEKISNPYDPKIDFTITFTSNYELLSNKTFFKNNCCFLLINDGIRPKNITISPEKNLLLIAFEKTVVLYSGIDIKKENFISDYRFFFFHEGDKCGLPSRCGKKNINLKTFNTSNFQRDDSFCFEVGKKYPLNNETLFKSYKEENNDILTFITNNISFIFPMHKDNVTTKCTICGGKRIEPREKGNIIDAINNENKDDLLNNEHRILNITLNEKMGVLLAKKNNQIHILFKNQKYKMKKSKIKKIKIDLNKYDKILHKCISLFDQMNPEKFIVVCLTKDRKIIYFDSDNIKYEYFLETKYEPIDITTDEKSQT